MNTLRKLKYCSPETVSVGLEAQSPVLTSTLAIGAILYDGTGFENLTEDETAFIW